MVFYFFVPFFLTQFVCFQRKYLQFFFCCYKNEKCENFNVFFHPLFVAKAPKLKEIYIIVQTQHNDVGSSFVLEIKKKIEAFYKGLNQIFHFW